MIIAISSLNVITGGTEMVESGSTGNQKQGSILITGGGGFVGLNLARELIERGQQVVLVRRHAFELPSFLAPFAGKEVITAQADIAEPAVIYSLIRQYNIESIIHAAVLNESSGASLYEASKVNIQGTVEILEAARIFNLRRVTFLSSVAVYMPVKDMNRILYEDDDLPVAATEWLVGTKRAGEQVCQLYAHDYGLSVPIVRPPQIYGPLFMSRRSPLKSMIENGLVGKSSDFTNIYGNAQFGYVYVHDCTRAISLVHLAPSLKHGIYNISDGKAYRLTDIAKAVMELFPGISITLGNTRSGHIAEAPPMSIDRIREDVGFTPQYDLKRAIRAYADWVRDGKYR
jgi:UDP-glucose 4-epimerase